MGYWLTKDPRAEATEKTATYERGTYIFFDPASWGRVEQKDFNLAYEALEDRQPGPLAAQHQQHQLHGFGFRHFLHHLWCKHDVFTHRCRRCWNRLRKSRVALPPACSAHACSP